MKKIRIDESLIKLHHSKIMDSFVVPHTETLEVKVFTSVTGKSFYNNVICLI